jgi:integrase
MALMQYHLCQRPGDIRNMTWDNIEGDTIRFTQEKTQVQVTAPLTERLKERLKETPRSEHTNNIVYHSSRRPDALGKVAVGVNYNRRLYPKHATIVKRAAGIDETLWMSDLRRTGATEMANAGCTDDEMRSVTGHKTRDILSIYLVLDKTTSTNAMNKRFG